MYAGVYIDQRFGNFDRKYTSEYVRAMETAGLMNLGGPKWFCDFFISERLWGDLDSLTEQERQDRFGEALKMRDVEPFFWSPPGGESFAQLCLRVDRMLATLARECSDKRVVIVCHGEVMWAFRIRLERMSQVRFKELHLSRKGEDRIHNCQILHYMRRDPEAGALSKYYDHMQIIRPTESPAQEFPVVKIERPAYTSGELLGVVDNFEQLVA